MMKKFKSMLFVLVMVIVCSIPTTVMAAQDSCWEKEPQKEAWTYTDGQGTDLSVRLENNILYIKGEGAIPNYSREALGNRPWHNKTIYTVEIDHGVTSIGSEAFSNLKDLHKVSMPASVFIEDSSAFAGASEGCIFEIRGMNIVSRDIGKVPYDSMDSIAAFMERYNGVYKYQLDNYYMISLVQSTVTPKVKDVSPRDAQTTYSNVGYPIIDYKSTLSMVSTKPDYTMSTSIVNKQQGKEALEVFSAVLGDHTYATAYNMSVNSVRGMVKTTAKPLTYKMTIPKAFQKSGRQFTLIQLGSGVVNFLADEDMDDTTLTFTTAKSTATVALVYKDALTVE